MFCQSPRDPEDLSEVTRLVREAASDPNTEFIYTYHGDERCLQRQVHPEIVQRALSNGQAVSCEKTRKGRRLVYRYLFIYKDDYGTIEPVVQITSRGALVIITVRRRDR